MMTIIIMMMMNLLSGAKDIKEERPRMQEL